MRHVPGQPTCHNVEGNVMAHLKPHFKKKPTIPSVEWSLPALFFVALQASAQTAETARPDASLAPVTISERASAVVADVGGF
ncbi:MAG: hypothetical protein KAY54_06000, partial [Burkholderiaceae bacterium]|nr:hypothetical protein [Burkholderiaceae bacterium]